jgi:hypothetical protein
LRELLTGSLSFEHLQVFTGRAPCGRRVFPQDLPVIFHRSN